MSGASTRRSFASTPEAQYTAEGQRRVDAYDVLTDDPSFQCIPSSIGRAWDEPDTNVEIRQFNDRVEIHYRDVRSCAHGRAESKTAIRSSPSRARSISMA